ncbi:MAG TPA: hypothetical protein VEU06_02580 [Micropepsaceae bacterium]|nr:hypothetical protein [Micropepsaceae bacterium]
MTDDQQQEYRLTEYRLRAAYCREMAKAAGTIQMRDEWDRLANTWLSMVPKDVETDAEGFCHLVHAAESGAARTQAA